MEIISKLQDNKNAFTKKIKESRFIEGVEKESSKSNLVDDICECFIANNEIEYATHESKDTFTKSMKLDIASTVDTSLYVKTFTRNMIQAGLQKKNYFSSILYLNDYYKTNCIIYNKATGKYYSTCLKKYEPFICLYENDKWSIMDIAHINEASDSPTDMDLITFSPISELEHILTMDFKLEIPYKTDLMSIGKYKAKELEDIAKTLDIPLSVNGKKKVKKVLYDDINLKYCQQLI